MRRAFINARFYQNANTAVLVDDGRFVLFGNDREIEKTAGFDEVVNLGGMYVYPGFVDSHMHLAELGMYMNEIQLKTCTSLDSIKKRIIRQSASRDKGTWLQGRGWIEEHLEGIPDKKFLDSVSADYPISLTRADGHMMSVNSAALKAAGIDGDRNMDGGYIDFSRGLIYENAMNIIADAQPKMNEETIQHYISDGADMAASCGITTVGSDDFLSVIKDYRPVLNTFEKMSYQQKLNVRVNEQCEFSSPEEFAAFLDDGYTFDIGNDFFRIGPLKLVTDGSLGAHTACLTRPYLSEAGNQGMMLMDENEIETFVQLAHHFNMPVIAHAIGDAAVDIMLDSFRRNTYELYHSNPLHDGLVHCQILRKDQIEKILKYQLSCFFQSQFIEEDAELMKDIDPALREFSYPFKALFEGTLASNGSDAPVEMPDVLKGMFYSETRRSSSGRPLNPEEALTRRQAFDSFTAKGYEQLFMNDRAGKMQEGYLADFTVIDQDIIHCDIDLLKKAKIMMTVMNGNTVFEK